MYNPFAFCVEVGPFNTGYGNLKIIDGFFSWRELSQLTQVAVLKNSAFVVLSEPKA